jgi:hypothetical protein
MDLAALTGTCADGGMLVPGAGFQGIPGFGRIGIGGIPADYVLVIVQRAGRLLRILGERIAGVGVEVVVIAGYFPHDSFRAELNKLVFPNRRLVVRLQRRFLVVAVVDVFLTVQDGIQTTFVVGVVVVGQVVPAVHG